ncbi:MAG: hypothetical protein WBD73_03815 [Candidatus Acidiferrales bacterium]
MSSDARGVELFPGGVRTRPGLVSVYPALSGTPSTTSSRTWSGLVTGLAAGTAYYFCPYWDETAVSLVWVLGGAGNPANAHVAKRLLRRSNRHCRERIPLSVGAMSAATTSSGTGGGSGGGSGSCVRAGMTVLTHEHGTMEIEKLRVGDRIILRRDAWTSVVRHEVHPANTLVRLQFSNEDTLDVAPHHVFYGRGWRAGKGGACVPRRHSGRTI